MKNGLVAGLVNVVFAVGVVSAADAMSISSISQLQSVYSRSDNSVYFDVQSATSPSDGIIEVSTYVSGGELAPGVIAGTVWGWSSLNCQNYFDQDGDYRIDVTSSVNTYGTAGTPAQGSLATLIGSGQSKANYSAFFSIEKDTSYEALFTHYSPVFGGVGYVTLTRLDNSAIIFDINIYDDLGPFAGSLLAGSYEMQFLVDTGLVSQSGEGKAAICDMYMGLTVNADLPAPTPEPATMLLFCSGLTGLIGVRMFRKKA